MTIQAAQAVQTSQTVQTVQTVQAVQAPPPSEPAASGRAVYDEYIPETEPAASTGLYQIAHDEEGTPYIRFDAPAEETTTTNTDAVDQEIRQLKEQRDRLVQQVRAAQDPQSAQTLAQKLQQIEQELRQKDQDAYRRQHAVIS